MVQRFFCTERRTFLFPLTERTPPRNLDALRTQLVVQPGIGNYVTTLFEGSLPCLARWRGVRVSRCSVSWATSAPAARSYLVTVTSVIGSRTRPVSPGCGNPSIYGVCENRRERYHSSSLPQPRRVLVKSAVPFRKSEHVCTCGWICFLGVWMRVWARCVAMYAAIVAEAYVALGSVSDGCMKRDEAGRATLKGHRLAQETSVCSSSWTVSWVTLPDEFHPLPFVASNACLADCRTSSFAKACPAVLGPSYLCRCHCREAATRSSQRVLALASQLLHSPCAAAHLGMR